MFTAIVELVEVRGGWVGRIGSFDCAAGSNAVAFHCWDDDELRVDSEGDHQHHEAHGRKHRARFVDAPGRSEREQCQSHHSRDQSHPVKDAQQLANDDARSVGVRPQRGEGDGGYDGEKDLRAQPDDEREIKKSAEKSLQNQPLAASFQPLALVLHQFYFCGYEVHVFLG